MKSMELDCAMRSIACGASPVAPETLAMRGPRWRERGRGSRIVMIVVFVGVMAVVVVVLVSIESVIVAFENKRFES